MKDYSVKQQNNQLKINCPNYRIAFMGTSKISVACLNALLRLPITVVLIITKEDKFGNRHRLQIPELKQTAISKNFPFIQPMRLSECISFVSELKPDFLVTCSFGKIVPLEFLKIFKKCINVHASLLPAYRGASPIQMAIQNGDKITGISLMEMVAKLDAGQVYWQNQILVDKNDTYDSLLDKFMQNFNDQFLNAFVKIFNNEIIGTSQNDLCKRGAKLTFAPIITKEMCFIDWSQSAETIHAHIRSLYSKPLAMTRYEDFIIKVLSSFPIKTNTWNSDKKKYEPGEIIKIDRDGILVATGDGDLLIQQIQLPNKNPIRIVDLINGKHRFEINKKFF